MPVQCLDSWPALSRQTSLCEPPPSNATELVKLAASMSMNSNTHVLDESPCAHKSKNTHIYVQDSKKDEKGLDSSRQRFVGDVDLPECMFAATKLLFAALHLECINTQARNRF